MIINKNGGPIDKPPSIQKAARDAVLNPTESTHECSLIQHLELHEKSSHPMIYLYLDQK